MVRKEARDALENTLNFKIYFDPTAAHDKRGKQVAAVRQTWENLVARDLVKDVRRRWPLEYYYDLNTGELFEDKAGLGPIETASGPYGSMPAGVIAVVFACRECGDTEDRYVAWLEVPLAVLKKHGVPFSAAGISGGGRADAIMIRTPEGGEWVMHGTEAADAITDAAKRCGEQVTPIVCQPGQ